MSGWGRLGNEAGGALDYIIPPREGVSCAVGGTFSIIIDPLMTRQARIHPYRYSRGSATTRLPDPWLAKPLIIDIPKALDDPLIHGCYPWPWTVTVVSQSACSFWSSRAPRCHGALIHIHWTRRLSDKSRHSHLSSGSRLRAGWHRI